MSGALVPVMRLSRVCLGLAGLLSASAYAGDVEACSPEPEAFSVHSFFPVGADARLNGAVYVGLEQVNPDGVSEGYPELSLVDVSTEQRVALNHGSSWLEQGRLVESYGPTVPLRANTTYRAELTFAGFDDDAQPDARDTSWEFTTGEESLPALSASGALRVALEPGEEVVVDCSDADSCGNGCVDVGIQPATRAVITLPTFHGGEEEFIYQGELVVTRDTPALPHSSGLYLSREGHEFVVGISDMSNQSLSITLPETAEAYRPCFAISARDAAGQRVFPEPVCLTELVQPRPASTSNGEDDTVGDDDGTATARPTGGGGQGGTTKASGCSLGSAGSEASASLLLLALAAAVIARRRRFSKKTRFEA